MSYLIWFFLLFTSFNGFGLRTPSWGGVGNANLGWFGALQLLVLVTILIVPLRFRLRTYFDTRNNMGLPLALVFLLLIIICIEGLLFVIFKPAFQAIYMFENLAQLKYIVMYFIFVYLLSKPNGVDVALKSIMLSSIICSCIVFFIIIWGHKGTVIQVVRSNMITSQFRILLPTGMLITAGFFLFFTKLLYRKKLQYAIGSLFCAVPIVLQMHRGVLISFTIVLLFALCKVYKFEIKKFIFFTFIAILTFGFAFVAMNQVGYGKKKLESNFIATSKEIESGSGDFGVRLFLPYNSFIYTVENYGIFGVGLDWPKNFNFEKYYINRFWAGPTLDSGYNNIIIVYGLLGVFVYLFLFFRSFSSIKKISNLKLNDEYKFLPHFAQYTFMYLLLTSISSDNFLLYDSTFVFIFILALIYSLEGRNRLRLCQNRSKSALAYDSESPPGSFSNCCVSGGENTDSLGNEVFSELNHSSGHRSHVE